MKLVSTKRLGSLLLTGLLVACSPAASSPTPSANASAPASPEASADASAAASPSAIPAPSGDPIVVGSTLSLTGAFGATGIIHKIAGEQFVAHLNATGGLLGRPVEWTVLDDESVGDRASQLY